MDIRTFPPRDDGILLEDIEEVRDMILELDPNATVDVHGDVWTDDMGNERDPRHFHVDFEFF